METAQEVPTKKTAAKKAAPKKAAPRAAPRAAKGEKFSLKTSAEKAVNVYLGMIGKGFDSVQANLESARKINDKRVKDLEKRGAKLRKELEKRVDNIETPDFENIVEDAKAQFNKVQDQVEETVESIKEKLTPAKAA